MPIVGQRVLRNALLEMPTELRTDFTQVFEERCEDFFIHARQNAVLQLESSRVLSHDGSLFEGASRTTSIFGTYFVSGVHPDYHRSSPPIEILNLLIPEVEIATPVVSVLLLRLSVHKSV